MSGNTQPNFFVDKGDDALRFVGTVELWKNIVVSVVFALAGVVAIVAVVRYHSGWKSGDFKVTQAQCSTPSTQQSCTGKKCSTSTVTHCSKLGVDGFAPFVTQYTHPAQPPSVGESVKVFYNPSDKKQAFLAHDDAIDEYKGWIIGALALVVLGLGFSAWFQFYVRKSHLAQRVAGGGALFDMVT